MTHEARRRPYVIVDVFTETPFQGNPLAVVFEAEDLSDAAMQTIAAEFNLSETVFVFPPKKLENSAALRIFTPGAELPFAGHPTVGTAVLLGRRKLGAVAHASDIAVALEERVGLVRAGVVVKPGRVGHATFTLPQKPVHVQPSVSRIQIASALGLDEEDIGFDRHRPAIYSAGVPFTLVPLRSLDALRRVRPDLNAWSRAFENSGRDNAFVYARGGAAPEAAFQARMFWPGAGIKEDPATGGAIAALAGAIVDYEKLKDDTHVFLIEQGYQMGRPSDIMLEIDIEGGAYFAGRIGGSAVIVAEGEIYA